MLTGNTFTDAKSKTYVQALALMEKENFKPVIKIGDIKPVKNFKKT
ncbi:MAG: hypothetical protein V3U57_05815 [Robiginitomaculum sp.]